MIRPLVLYHTNSIHNISSPADLLSEHTCLKLILKINSVFRQRFDSFGRGLGLDGRRDRNDVLNLQWDSISPSIGSGNLMAIPPIMAKVIDIKTK
jgi:hypothetical protein